MQDLENLALDPKYNDVLKTNGEIRPIWMLLVDRNYLTVRTHASGQSKYNLVERGMAILSGKLADITLPVNHFGSHLNTQGKVIDLELALQNFRYAEESLCDIWRKDLIFRKSVDAHCYGPPHTKEATELLLLNNNFLPPITKAKDRHFTNPIHLLEYYDLLKIPGYDSHCSSLNQIIYSRLCCTVCNKYFPTLAYLTKHKKAMHPVNQGRPKGKFKNNLNSLDDSSLLTSQQNEICLREYMSDNE
ncbi:hypothetical protein GLOIN_2v1783204 [Rhizophagus clarus]|uniref:C2H2-type domain-containing protein n=1 Tax=Rhizophagus clarus TaxID=94130 RepID=A0A8H3LVM5_9GLOM|nr:hypothetical protein GLOIN_2v1783204 [Rhizophagus clarus]